MALSTSKPKLTPVVTPSSLEDKNDKVKKNPSPPPPKLQSPPPMTHPLPPNEILTKTTIPAFQAYKCLHARGAIAHEKPITKYYTWTEIQKDADEKKSVNDIFEKFGGTKEIDSVDAIKEELMNRGPVVSVSFRLLSDYLDQLTVGKKAFAKELIGGVHELLIVGWCLTPYGEAWQIQPLIDESSEPKDLKAGAKSDALIQIGFGQFGIDDTVMAPASSLDNIPWQHGPYFDSDFSGIENWRSWEEMDLPIMETELKILAQNCFKKGLMLGGSFVLRDQNRKAHSARYEVKNVKWMEDTSEWFVTICRQGKC